MRTGNYGRITAMALDPIEKKPLKMFHPGSMILSIGSYGCNLRCPWCQNHSISMPEGRVDSVEIMPAAMADRAAEIRGNLGLAYTYNEPLASWDYVRDTSILIHEKGMKNVLVTNGCFSDEILDQVLAHIDAMNIDLKCFSDAAYRELGGDLETVKHFIERSAAACHVELTTLIVPGVSDSGEDMARQARWIAGIDRNMPLHVTRFFPAYKMAGGRPTGRETVLKLAEIAGTCLDNVFTGNM